MDWVNLARFPPAYYGDVIAKDFICITWKGRYNKLYIIL